MAKKYDTSFNWAYRHGLPCMCGITGRSPALTDVSVAESITEGLGRSGYLED